jgi:hypothetical protein
MFFMFILLITALRHSSFFLSLKTKNLILLHEEGWFSVLDDMARFSDVLFDQSLTRTSQEQMNGLVMPSFT